MIVISKNTSGHRGHWLALCRSVAPVETVSEFHLSDVFRMIREEESCFFLNIDDHFLEVIVVGLVRRLLGRRTSALILAPQKVINPRSFQHRVKSALYNAAGKAGIRLHPCVSGFPSDEFAGNRFSASLVDLNAVDLVLEPFPAEGSLPPELSSVNKPLLASVGHQHPLKRPDLLMQAYLRSAALRQRAHFGIFGRLEHQDEALVREFVAAGGIVVDRFLRHDELGAVYRNSAIIWCLYDRTYDQTSGAFGHAFQLAKPCLVRKESLLHRIQRDLGYDLAAADSPDAVIAALSAALDRLRDLDSLYLKLSASQLAPKVLKDWRDVLTEDRLLHEGVCSWHVEAAGVARPPTSNCAPMRPCLWATRIFDSIASAHRSAGVACRPTLAKLTHGPWT